MILLSKNQDINIEFCEFLSVFFLFIISVDLLRTSCPIVISMIIPIIIITDSLEDVKSDTKVI